MSTASATATPSTAAKLDGLLRRYITQATIALAVIVGVTGVMMFFHVAKGEVEGVHEWLGLAFAVVAILHGVRHRHVIGTMLGQTRMRVLAAVVAAVAVAFVALPSEKGPNPFRQATQVVMQAPLQDLAPVIGVTVQELADRLDDEGFPVADTTQSIQAIARTLGADPVQVMQAALRK